jgi:hypothetical protein
MKKNRLEYFKKIFDLVRYQFHKPETEKPNQKIKKPNQTETKPVKKSKKIPKNNIVFYF